jgi:hypothetical protein
VGGLKNAILRYGSQNCRQGRARRAACVGVRDAANESAFRCGSGKLPVRSVPTVVSAMDRARASYGTQKQPGPHAPDLRRRKSCERFGRHAREAAGCLNMAFLRSPSFARTPSGKVTKYPRCAHPTFVGRRSAKIMMHANHDLRFRAGLFGICSFLCVTI